MPRRTDMSQSKGLCNQWQRLLYRPMHGITSSTTKVRKARTNIVSKDASYQSRSCSSRCTNYQNGDLVYNPDTNLWACCGTLETCNNPTDETFLAPEPQQLLTAASLRSTATSAPTGLSHATLSGTVTPSAIMNRSSSLSEGARIGIGVSAALAAVAIVSLVSWVVLLRKRLRSRSEAQNFTGSRNSRLKDATLPEGHHLHASREHELSGQGWPHEMEGR